MSKNSKKANPVDQEAEVNLMYIRDHLRHPIGALAVRRIKDGIIEIAISKCHPSDRFKRPVARNRAIGRLNSSKYSIRSVVDTDKIKEELPEDIINFLDMYRIDFEQEESIHKFIEVHCVSKASKSLKA